MPDPLLLLPGMMCDARLFEPQIAAFSAARPIVTYTPIGADSMSALTRDVLAIAPPAFALAGLSMGGILAMEIIRQAPGRVSRIALLDTNHLADPPERVPVRRAQMQAVRDGRLRDVMRDEMKPNYLADGPAKAGVLDLCMVMAETLGPDAFIRQSKALLQRDDQTETLRSIKVPTLVLCGAEDKLCPPSRHRMMQELVDGATCEIISGAGHLPTLEQPERTNDALRAWLAR